MVGLFGGVGQWQAQHRPWLIVHTRVCANEKCIVWRGACLFLCVQLTDGSSPLFMASQSGHTEAVQALLTAGAAVDQAMVSCRCDESSAKGIATSGLYACMSLLLHVLCV